mgnify:CR=1 FL=1
MREADEFGEKVRSRRGSSAGSSRRNSSSGSRRGSSSGANPLLPGLGVQFGMSKIPVCGLPFLCSSRSDPIVPSKTPAADSPAKDSGFGGETNLDIVSEALSKLSTNGKPSPPQMDRMAALANPFDDE